MTHQPKRIRRSRKKGVALPQGAIFVAGTTRWTNPFAQRRLYGQRMWGHAKSTILHKSWLRGEIGALSLERMGFSAGEIAELDRRRAWILTHLHELAGRDLACWCPLTSAWCHADTYLALAPSYAELERIAA